MEPADQNCTVVVVKHFTFKNGRCGQDSLAPSPRQQPRLCLVSGVNTLLDGLSSGCLLAPVDRYGCAGEGGQRSSLSPPCWSGTSAQTCQCLIQVHPGWRQSTGRGDQGGLWTCRVPLSSWKSTNRCVIFNTAHTVAARLYTHQRPKLPKFVSTWKKKKKKTLFGNSNNSCGALCCSFACVLVFLKIGDERAAKTRQVLQRGVFEALLFPWTPLSSLCTVRRLPCLGSATLSPSRPAQPPPPPQTPLARVNISLGLFLEVQKGKKNFWGGITELCGK